jgi:hypothetical protein
MGLAVGFQGVPCSAETERFRLPLRPGRPYSPRSALSRFISRTRGLCDVCLETPCFRLPIPPRPCCIPIPCQARLFETIS